MGNACGLIAILHGILNSQDLNNFIVSDSILAKFKNLMGPNSSENELILNGTHQKYQEELASLNLMEKHANFVNQGQSKIDNKTD